MTRIILKPAERGARFRDSSGRVYLTEEAERTEIELAFLRRGNYERRDA